MLITIPFFAGDKDQAIRLANWIQKLGGVGHHDCLLVVDKGTHERGVVEPCQAAFRSVTVIRSEPVPSKGKWGDGTTDASGPNEMFLSALEYVPHKFKCRWFWLEVDAAPTRSTWADEIEKEDREARKPFMGAYVNIPPHEPHMSGIAVYPPNVPDYSMDMALPGKIAWDYAGRRDTVGRKLAHFTKLIQHEYRIHGKSPEFPDADSLSVIKPETAVFHRCKPTKDEAGNGTTTSSLIDRLEERLAAQKPAPKAAPSREQTLEARVKELEAQIEKLSQGNAQSPVDVMLKKANENPPRMPKGILDLPMGPAPFPKGMGETANPKLAKRIYGKNPKKKKRTLSPEHKAKLKAAWEKRKAATA